MSARRIVLALLMASGLATSAFAQTIEYYHLDALGSVRAVTNESGNVIERHDYLPFGEECTTGACAANASLPGDQPRQYTGKERDAETGLDYFGARYYAAGTGRFTTVDPLYTWTDNLADPDRWNRYAYARNNPLRYVDPDGRSIKLAKIAFQVGKALYLGQDIYSSVSGIADAAGTIFSADASVGTGETAIRRTEFLSASPPT